MAVFDICRRMTRDLSLYCYILLNVQKKILSYLNIYYEMFLCFWCMFLFLIFKYVFKYCNTTLVSIIILALALISLSYFFVLFLLIRSLFKGINKNLFFDILD